MVQKIFIINGMGTSGKDTFVSFVQKEKPFEVWNFSSVDKVKEIATYCGWDGGKTEKDRKLLSDLKLLLTDYNDLPMNTLKDKVSEFLKSNAHALFLHIREPEEIERAKQLFNATTILVRRDSVPHIHSNMADDNVYNYKYDMIVENNGTLEDLQEIAKKFAENI